MKNRKSYSFETWAQLPDVVKIEQFLKYQGFKLIYNNSINDLYTHDGVVISIRKLRMNKNE